MKRFPTNPMLRCLLTALLAVFPAAAQNAQPGQASARTAVRGKSSETELWLRFVAIPNGARVRSIDGQGTLELGRISYLTGASEPGVTIKRGARTFTVSTRFGLQIGTGNVQGTAKLLAMLTQVSPEIRVAIDGVNLSPAPEVVQVGMRCGAVTEHLLEIEIPVSMPDAAAQVVNAISFQVISN